MNNLRHNIGDSDVAYHKIEPFDIDCFNCVASAEVTFAVVCLGSSQFSNGQKFHFFIISKHSFFTLRPLLLDPRTIIWTQGLLSGSLDYYLLNR